MAGHPPQPETDRTPAMARGRLRRIGHHAAAVLPQEITDLFLLAGVGLPAGLLAARFGLGDRMLAWMAEHGMGRLQPDTLIVGLSLGIVGFGWFAARRRHQARRNAHAHAQALDALREARMEALCARDELARANLRLVGAIETIPEGIAIFDSDDRFVLWNRHYTEFYKESAARITHGARFEDALRYGAERGIYRIPPGRTEDWLARRLDLHARKSGSHEEEMSDGRWLRIEERRLADGGSVAVRIDITDLKRRESSHRLLFEANPLPMWVYDRETLRFLAVNDAMVLHYGYGRERFLDMTIEQIRPPEEIARLHADLAEPHAALRHSQEPWRHRKADGTLIDIHFASHWLDFEGRRAVLVVAIDVTAARAAEAELKRARDAAEAGSRAKSEFLANMSHELRTPLNAIIGFSQLIIDQPTEQVPPEHVEYARDINRGGQHLLALVNEILDHAKAESGQMTLRLEPVSLPRLATQCVRFVREQADTARLRIAAELPPDDIVLPMDELRLRQSLLNLLSNAIKFTPAGGKVTLSVDRDRDHARIRVADTGVGMSADGVVKALEPFQQLENPKTRRNQGTGLGLPIAKRLVELQGGTFIVESQPQAGTTVTILLPLPQDRGPGRRTADPGTVTA